jgi:hypothetical protein
MKDEDLSIEEIEKEIQRKAKLRHLKSLMQEDHRAQSITIGTAGGGTTEITLRGIDGSYLWLVQQPVEVIELINQLSANIGCHIHIQPRNDFSSWRQWKELSEEERLHLNGFPPFPNDMAISRNVGKGLASPHDRLKAQPTAQVEEKENAVATKKAVNKRTPKRSRSTTK